MQLGLGFAGLEVEKNMKNHEKKNTIAPQLSQLYHTQECNLKHIGRASVLTCKIQHQQCNLITKQ